MAKCIRAIRRYHPVEYRRNLDARALNLNHVCLHYTTSAFIGAASTRGELIGLFAYVSLARGDFLTQARAAKDIDPAIIEQQERQLRPRQYRG